MLRRMQASAKALPVCLLSLACALPAYGQAAAKPEPLAPLTRFICSWAGAATGEPGEGTVARTYERAVQGRYLRESNVSRYAAKQADKPGEMHEHLSMFSYDRARKGLVLRQFHAEGFVNNYRQAARPVSCRWSSRVRRSRT